MEEYVNISYVIPLILLWIVFGWINMVKAESEKFGGTVLLHYTFLYQFFTVIPVIAVLVSLIINISEVGWASTFCYVGILTLVQFINATFIHPIYNLIFGYDGVGTLIPVIAILPLIIYLFVVQFS